MTVAIIQARMGSTRLPGKVLLPLAGAPMLQQVVERVRRARLVNDVLIATTTGAADDPLEALGREIGCAVFRGDENDVLDRYFRAAQAAKAGIVVRITSDCPLIDPGIIDEVLAELIGSNADYVSNVAPTRTFPRGLDTEAFRFVTLDRCWHDATEPACREHVTAFLHRHPDHFHIRGIVNDTDQSAHRWTVDTAEDYELVAAIYAHFGHNRFGWREVLALVSAHPEWSRINAHVRQKAH
jgi:spore coat polysaccharide biosynthesis protein SpsF (cytidylyltransferase family)